jgi:type VI secretion system protein ImpK
MTEPKDPFEPAYNPNERTVVRPNPGGRRPVAPSPPSSQPEQPGPFTPSAYPPPPASYHPASGYQPPPSYPQADPNAAAQDAWADAPGQSYPQPAPPPYQPPPAQSYAPPPQSAPQPQAPGSVPQVAPREMPVAPNANPIMSAAAPILSILGRLRVALAYASFSQLMDQVAGAIQRFEADVTGAGIGQDQAKQAKYTLCATADDIVQNIPAQDRQLWTQYSMLSRFFGERTGGIRFFEELDRAKQDPILNYNVLELQHACLALGFQGVHRTSAGGQATLQTIQRNLYETLRRVKQRVNQELSPRWQGQDMAARGTTVRIPFWAMASLAGVLLLAMYLTLRSLLSSGSDAVIDDVGRIFPTTDVSIERRVVQPVKPTPPPPIKTTQLERIRAALATEIGEQKLAVDSVSTGIIVRVNSFASFEPGKATVIDAFRPLAKRIAQTLEKEPGQIKVTGHSDNTPIKTVRFANNYELSVERAKAVGALLTEDLSDKKRILADGKGDTAPIASNDTIEGRARNRRVDVQIPHER